MRLIWIAIVFAFTQDEKALRRQLRPYFFRPKARAFSPDFQDDLARLEALNYSPHWNLV